MFNGFRVESVGAAKVTDELGWFVVPPVVTAGKFADKVGMAEWVCGGSVLLVSATLSTPPSSPGT
jgi:hypothetical protein